MDEDPLLDDLEEIQKEGNNIFEYHGADLFPERWFKLVVVLNTGFLLVENGLAAVPRWPTHSMFFSDNSILYKRLEDRNYSASKIQENVECEIMRMIAEEARQGYKEDVVVYLESNTVEDMENNSENIINWIKQHS